MLPGPKDETAKMRQIGRTNTPSDPKPKKDLNTFNAAVVNFRGRLEWDWPTLAVATETSSTAFLIYIPVRPR